MAKAVRWPHNPEVPSWPGAILSAYCIRKRTPYDGHQSGDHIPGPLGQVAANPAANSQRIGHIRRLLRVAVGRTSRNLRRFGHKPAVLVCVCGPGPWLSNFPRMAS